ncbi:MAG: hypothetical protein ACR2I0_15975 [Rhodoferax sp.]
MSTATVDEEGPEQPTERHIPELSKDMFVYAGIAVLVWAAREISLLELFKPSDDLGYWLGVAGASAMFLLLSYPIRKHFRFAHNLGPVKRWLAWHMLLGVGGPTLILIHSGFRFGSLNAGVALWSMIIVAASGVVGRFIYTRINRGLHGERAALQDLKGRAGIEQEGARSRLRFAPEVEKLLMSFNVQVQGARPGWVTHLQRVFVLPAVQWTTYVRSVYLLRQPLEKLGKRHQWDASQVKEHRRLARKLVRRYLNAVVRVAQFGSYEWMLSAWHVAHIPFVFLLGISTLIHIFAVHAY